MEVSVNPDQSCIYLDKEVYFGEDWTEKMKTSHNNIQARDIDRDESEQLLFHHKEKIMAEDPNLGVRDFTRAGVCADIFRGPILVTRMGCYADGVEEYRDMDNRDARNAADFFSSAFRLGQKGAGLQDVRVMAIGALFDSILKEGQHFSFLKEKEGRLWHTRVLDGCDSIFSAEGSGIANLLGIPILLRRCDELDIPEVLRPACRRHSKKGQGLYNINAMFLKRDITSTTTSKAAWQPTNRFGAAFIGNYGQYAGEDGFGSSPKMWNDTDTGIVMVARADGRPLVWPHFVTLCRYISTRVEPRLAQAISGLAEGSVVRERESVLNSITKAEFLDVWDRMKADRETDLQWCFCPDPYEIGNAADFGAEATIHSFELNLGAQISAGIVQESERPEHQICSVLKSEFGSKHVTDEARDITQHVSMLYT
jgi:hypothetical protein